jgi:hypothetical protein
MPTSSRQVAISADIQNANNLQELSPQEAEYQRREGYIPELPDAEPGVIQAPLPPPNSYIV